MEFRDLKRQYSVLKQEIDKAVANALSSGAYIMGQPVKELEALLAEYVGSKHCISCGNGTDALTISLKTLGIGEGKAVFLPDFTFFATAEVVAMEGAHPVFVDVDEKTFNISPQDLETKIKETIADGKYTPAAIITVDLFGLPADYPAIEEIACKYAIPIIEDGAQGFGGEIEGKRSCSFGTIGTTSFFPAKPLGCYGDGGAIFTDNEEFAHLADSYRVHGKGSYKYDNVRIGLNSRLDTIQAAILQVKLNAFKEYELEAVNKVAGWYNDRLCKIVETPFIPDGYKSSWAQYTIKLPTQSDRDDLQAKLRSSGIPSMVYYPIPMHKQSAFSGLHTSEEEICPVATSLSQRVLSLPMHPYMTKEDVDFISSVIYGHIAD